jgi:hypothetical protein
VKQQQVMEQRLARLHSIYSLFLVDGDLLPAGKLLRKNTLTDAGFTSRIWPSTKPKSTFHKGRSIGFRFRADWLAHQTLVGTTMRVEVKGALAL